MFRKVFEERKAEEDGKLLRYYTTETLKARIHPSKNLVRVTLYLEIGSLVYLNV